MAVERWVTTGPDASSRTPQRRRGGAGLYEARAAVERLGLLVLWVLVLIGCDGHAAGAVEADEEQADRPATQRVTLADDKFDLELAMTPGARQRGLSGRERIDAEGGMLFVFPDDQVRVQGFWMKDCLVDIDIIFLDRDGRITAMHHMPVEPPDERDVPRRTYSSRRPAQFAIELRGGTLEGLELKVGQRIDFPRRALVERAE